MKRKIIKFAALLLFFSLIVGGLGALLRYRYPDSIVPMRRFYDQKENSVDLLGLGTSHIYEGIAPAVLYREYGVAAYDLCAPAQAIWSTYHYFVEALKTQSPRAAVFDVYMLNTNTPYDTAANAIKSTYGMKWSRNRVDAIRAAFEDESFFTAFFPFLQYHSRYGEMTYSDTAPYGGNKNYYSDSFKGYTVSDEVKKIKLPDVTQFTDVRKLADKHEEYYRKIIELAIENEITLYVVSMPYALAKDTQTTVNSARQIAEGYGSEYVKFIDLAARKDEIGLDAATDFANNQHLNRVGSEKATRWLGEIITAEVKFEDRRGDPAYATWERDAENFYRAKNDNVLKTTTDPMEYSRLLTEMTDGYTVLLADNLGPGADFGAAMYFADCFNAVREDGNGLYLRENAENFRFLAGTGSEYRKYLRFNAKDEALLQVSADGAKPCSISVNGSARKSEAPGVTVVVYDEVLRSLVDAAILSPSKGIVR